MIKADYYCEQVARKFHRRVIEVVAGGASKDVSARLRYQVRLLVEPCDFGLVAIFSRACEVPAHAIVAEAHWLVYFASKASSHIQALSHAFSQHPRCHQRLCFLLSFIPLSAKMGCERHTRGGFVSFRLPDRSSKPWAVFRDETFLVLGNRIPCSVFGI